MPERAVNPPPRKAIQEIRSPNSRTGFYTELVYREDPAFQKLNPIARGTPYASVIGADTRIIAEYASNPLYFCKEVRPGNSGSSDFGSSDLQVLWVWATQDLAQDSFNSEITYEADGVSFPAFAREYDIRRKDYEASPTLTPTTALTGLLSVAITAAGAGYTQAAGTIATGATAEAVCLNGAIIDWIVTNEGTGVASGAALAITGDGTGATATARIQPASAVLIQQKKLEIPTDNPRSHDYVRVVRIYATMPGPELTDTIRSVSVRGRDVQIKTKKDLVGSISPETGSGIITSKVDSLTSVVAQRTTEKVATLPPDEAWAFWDFVPLPMLLFDIVHTIYCNDSPQATVVTNPVTGGGSSVLRKHRKTVSYSAAYPNPDLSGSSFATADVRYSGKIIQFAYGNVLNDAISYSEAFAWASGGSACAWTEEYDFAATSPDATTFLAGAWYVRSYDVEPWGESGFKSTKIEYYSADANPSI